MTWVRRYPFTISLLAAVCIAGGFVQLYPGSLSSDWSTNFGFAPRHFATGDLLRLITSIFLTHDWLHFGFAVTMISLVVGWSERTLGSRNSICIFVLSHLTSMLVFAIGVSALQSTYLNQTISALYDFHDVGPSAGYYGCLGAVLAAPKLSYRRLTVAGLLVFLTVRVVVSAKTMPDSHPVLSADIVHLIAMIAGMTIQLARFSIKRDRTAV